MVTADVCVFVFELTEAVPFTIFVANEVEALSVLDARLEEAFKTSDWRAKVPELRVPAVRVRAAKDQT